MTHHLISWGANSYGQLGHGYQSEQCPVAQEVDLHGCSLQAERVKKIAGGGGHTLILDDDGRVYSCGWNNKGQAGFPEKEDVLSFRRIRGSLEKESVIDIACGWASSAALTKEGHLFVWGSNYFGQLGRDTSTFPWTEKPTRVELNRKIVRVSMGLKHTALITEDCKVLVSGAGNKGQLGLNPSEYDNPRTHCTFTEVSALTDISDISCGQHHTVAVTKERELYMFGDNKHGQLAIDPEILPKSSVPVKLPSFQLGTGNVIHTGWSHTILLSDGQIFAWGRNTYGQLGSTEIERPTPWEPLRIKDVPKIQQISVGSEHSIAINEHGSILSWGWNEHGNCGTGTTRDVLRPQCILFPFEYSAILIGCGAGHTFAVIRRP